MGWGEPGQRSTGVPSLLLTPILSLAQASPPTGSHPGPAGWGACQCPHLIAQVCLYLHWIIDMVNLKVVPAALGGGAVLTCPWFKGMTRFPALAGCPCSVQSAQLWAVVSTAGAPAQLHQAAGAWRAGIALGRHILSIDNSLCLAEQQKTLLAF